MLSADVRSTTLRVEGANADTCASAATAAMAMKLRTIVITFYSLKSSKKRVMKKVTAM